MRDVPLRRLRSVPASDSGAPSTDDALWRAGRGDEQAFAVVYDSLASLVYGIALRVVRDPQMAEDVAQEAFVDAWRLASRFDPSRGTARSWLATITHRKAVDRVRSEEARRNREQRDAERSATTAADAAEQAEDRADRQRVADALDQLTHSQCEAVTLAYYGGRTYREVAELLHVPEGTAKTRIRDGLIRLRDMMKGEQ